MSTPKRIYYCPECGTIVAIDKPEKNDPVVFDAQELKLCPKCLEKQINQRNEYEHTNDTRK